MYTPEPTLSSILEPCTPVSRSNMSGRRSVRARKPVTYIEMNPEDPDEQKTTDHIGSTTINASTNNDPDFIFETDSSSESEMGKENCPPKKRKAIHDESSKQSLIQLRTEKSEVSQPGVAPSAQSSRLNELQKIIYERSRNSLSKHCDKSEETFAGIMSGINNVRANGTPLRSPSTAASITKKVGKNKIDGNTVEQWRRQLGNSCKANISFENWTIAASTHFSTDFSLGAFRALIVPNASEVHPEDFNESTPVVVARTESTSQAAAIFGSSKITGGSRYKTFKAYHVEFIFVASTKQLSVWWTMI
ncbi:hypothetical protein ACHWQZ_G006494 [Mnemiopsis leidyi]